MANGMRREVGKMVNTMVAYYYSFLEGKEEDHSLIARLGEAAERLVLHTGNKQRRNISSRCKRHPEIWLGK